MPKVAPNTDEPVLRDLFLLVGQSNMAGRGTLDGRTVPHPRVEMFTRDNNWTPATDPIHFDKPIAGVGPGLTYAATMVEEHPGVSIGLIPCAVGGTPLSRWSRGGDLYEAAVVRCRAATASGGVLRGILWHQGESDARNVASAKTYGTRLAAMIVAMRADLDAPDCPIVVGEIGEFVVARPDYPGAELVNAALRALPTQVTRSACVRATGLAHGGDSLHFSADAARELGRRYARQMLELQR